MPFTFAQMLVNLGVPPQWARRFMAARDGDATKMDDLQLVGVALPLAQELARYRFPGTSNPRRIIELGIPPEAAKLFCRNLTDVEPVDALFALSADDGSNITDDDDTLVETY